MTCCPTCGKPVTRATWDRAKIDVAIYQWVYQHGRPPRYEDWQRASSDGSRPTAETVRQHYGSFRAAIVANGYRPGTVLDRRRKVAA